MRRVVAILAVAALAGPGIGQAQSPASPVQLQDVVVSQQGDGVTVQIKTSAPARYEATLIDTPTRLVVDVQGIQAWPKSRVSPETAPIKEIRASQFKPGVARVVIELTRKVGYRIDAGPAGLAVVLEPSGTAKGDKAAAAKPTVPETTAPKAAPKPEPAPKAAAKAEVAPKPEAAPKAEVPKVPARAERPAPKVEAPVAPTPAPATVAAVTPPAPFQVGQARTGNGRLISMDFKDAEVVNLLRILAAESGKNIVAGPDVKGRVSVSLRNVTWEQALETVLEVGGLRKVERGDVIRIVSIDQLTREQEAAARVEEAKRKAEIDVRTKMVEAQIKEAELESRKLQTRLQQEETIARGPLREETIRLQYADAEEIARSLQGIMGIPPEGTAPVPIGAVTAPSVPADPTVVPSGGSPPNPELGRLPQPNAPFLSPPGTRGMISVSQDVLAKGITVRAHKPTNSIFIRHYQADLERIKKLIVEQLDIPLPQVKIEARMEILERNALEAIGVQWGGAGAGNLGHTTLVGQGFQTAPAQNVTGAFLPVTGGVLNPEGKFVPANTSIRDSQLGGMPNPNLTLSRLLPIDPTTGLPGGAGNLVNLPIQALTTGIPAGGVAFGLVGTNWNINLALQALATQGKTRTLARPEIVTIENNKAVMSLGREVPFATVSSAGTQIQFKEAVLKLEVTPSVIRERVGPDIINKIKMIVVVENNEPGPPVPIGAGTALSIVRRKAETLVVIKEGERLVIGGVTQDRKEDQLRKVPLLADVPVLGWFFKQKGVNDTGTELVVFITPSVLRNDVRAAR